MRSKKDITKYTNTVLIKSQAEIIARYKETLEVAPETRKVERMEYTRIMSFHTADALNVTDGINCSQDWAKECITEIDYSAKALLRRWESTIINGGSLEASQRYTEMYTAFKWMLGHSDCDTFPGTFGSSAGILNANSFQYIKAQITNGEWDNLTNQAIKTKRGE